MKTLIATTALIAAVFISGCQMPGKVVSETEVCPTCPKCKVVTTTGIIKGTTVTTVVCPNCQAEFEDHRVRDYAGPSADGKGIYHCDKCGKNYEVCPDCAKK